MGVLWDEIDPVLGVYCGTTSAQSLHILQREQTCPFMAQLVHVPSCIGAWQAGQSVFSIKTGRGMRGESAPDDVRNRAL